LGSGLGFERGLFHWLIGALESRRAISAECRQLTLTLPCCDHGALLTRVPGRFHGGINDVIRDAVCVLLVLRSLSP